MTPKFVTVGDDLKIREDHIPERLSGPSISSAAQSAALSAVQSMPDISGVAQYSRPNRPDPEFLQLFQPGHGWDGIGAGRAEYIPDDTTRYWRGTQCATIITTPTGELSSTLRKVNGLPTVDALGKALRISLKVNRPDLVRLFEIRWGPSATDGYRWRIWPDDLNPDEPQDFIFPLSNVIAAEGACGLTAEGAPDTTTGFSSASILVRTKDEGRTEPVIMSVQSVEIIPDPVETFPRGCISITFDDGWQNVWDLGKPIMDRHGIRSTQYVMASHVDSPSAAYMDREHIAALHRDGHEIALHAYDHNLHSRPIGYQSATEEEIRADFAAGRQWLLEQGFPADSFAYPKGRDKSTLTPGVSVRDIVPSYFQTGRLIRSGVMSAPPANLATIYAMSSIGEARVDGTAEALTAPGGLIDRVRATGGWLVMVLHHIVEDPNHTTPEYCSADAFDQILGYMREVGVETLPVREAVQRIISRT